MGIGITAVLGIASLVIGAVGAGVSYYSSNQAASQQNALAALNAQAQLQAIQQQGQTSRMQSAINQQMAANERAAFERNANTLESQAESNSALARENARRSREDFARMSASQRAQLAKAGVSDATGSPLVLLASTAEEEQRTVDQLRYEDETQRRTLFQEADNQRVQAEGAGMQLVGYQIQGAAARQQALTAASQTHLDLLSQQAGARAMRQQALGSLISSAGGLTKQAYGLQDEIGFTNWRTPRTSRSGIAKP